VAAAAGLVTEAALREDEAESNGRFLRWSGCQADRRAKAATTGRQGCARRAVGRAGLPGEGAGEDDGDGRKTGAAVALKWWWRRLDDS
jgi:hypothetical protein